MKLPLQISFRSLDRSETIEDRIWEEAAQSEFSTGIITWHSGAGRNAPWPVRSKQQESMQSP
jgi:hypothetical protein